MNLEGKRILFIAPASIPVDTAESIVNIKQLEILTQAGCIIDVISKKRKWTNYPKNDLLDTNVKLNSLHVIEVDNKLNWKTLKLHILTFLTFGVVFKGAHWAYLALQKSKELLKNNQYDCIMTKNGPSELVGYWIKKHIGLKWIATWNDPYPIEKYPHPYGKGIKAKVFTGARGILQIMEKYPDFHLFPSERLKIYMLQYLSIPEKKTRIVPHAVINQPINDHVVKEKLTILHSGNLKLPRDPKPFLKALSVFLKTHQNADIKIYFQGVLPDDLMSFVYELGIQDKIEILPTVSYKENMVMLSNYGVALIIEAPCNNGIFLPTKVSDYMQVGVPIFAISPCEGVLHDLYREKYVPYYADCINVDSIIKELDILYTDYCNGKIRNNTIPDSYMSESILKIIDGII